MLNDVLRRARVAESLIKARLEVDIEGLAAGVRARLEAQLPLTPLLIDANLGERRGHLGWGRIRTQAWSSPRLRKVLLSYVRVPPVISGVALVLLPAAGVDAPIFGADLMALPTRLSVNADVYGAPHHALAEVLQPLGESFVRLGTGAGPSWATPIASGVGLHARVSPRVVDDAFGALSAALARYLEVLETAPVGGSAARERVDEQRDFFSRFHAHGPRKGPLGRVFGAAWADRYSRLMFE